jgi:hypothetical protein
MNIVRKFRKSLFAKMLVALFAFALGALDVAAAAADPTSITTTATTAFEGVTVLVVAMVSFFIIVRIVKGIRK